MIAPPDDPKSPSATWKGSLTRQRLKVARCGAFESCTGHRPRPGRRPAAFGPLTVPRYASRSRTRLVPVTGQWTMGRTTMHIQDYVAAIIFGAVIGIIARILLPGRQRIGIILTVLIGMVAAVIGTWLTDKLNMHSTRPFPVA